MIEAIVGLVVGLRGLESVTAASGVVALSGVVASPIVASADGAAMAAVECKM